MTDLLLNDDNDLLIRNNDFVIGNSDQQHSTLLLITDKGEWKQNPLVGVGVISFLESEDLAGLLREIRMQFTNDGQNVEGVSIVNGKIEVKSKYP